MVQNTSFKVAKIEISYKPKLKASERPQITTTQQAYEGNTLTVYHIAINTQQLIKL